MKRSYTPARGVERATQTLKNLITFNLEDKIRFTEYINRALRVMRFAIHSGIKVSPYELHHGRKPRTELANIVKDNKCHQSERKTINVSVPPQHIPIYVARNERGEVTDHIVMAG